MCDFFFFLTFLVSALPGSLTIGMTFLFSPIAGILVDKIGIRTTTILGGGLATTGMLLSSLLCDKVFIYSLQLQL